eukprot:CAMPEP_0202376748 /NCGR_PEP_ID=MMETSP1127-20130417/7169_1 /ASSEMBLY_ACC=CAM_ASM_000462 /TAXON_ID=3047 /ORGANISM="Dunaliella tertiolecta, Strain CCMP1320" /LENGTH=299 /DNA_ID=CAMNT_0048974619 /DNA_START=396 /DNA_END=1296 /DNA_ORIENTATION=-
MLFAKVSGISLLHTVEAPKGADNSRGSYPRVPDPAAAPDPNIHHLVLCPPTKIETPYVQVGHIFTEDNGPLAEYAGSLDAAARRTLPGHLLRRCRILSSIRLGNVCQQRVALTACSGAESTFVWRLVQNSEATENQQGQHEGWRGAVNALEPKPSHWLVESVNYCKDVHEEDDGGKAELLTVPHPRLAPEAVIQSQLSCLQQGDMQAAELFCDAHRLASGEQGGISLRRLIRQQPYHRLLMVGRVVLGEAANVKEGVFLQAVHLEGGSKQSSALFVWELRLCPDNCWRVRAITHCPSPV